jgi:peptidoglycan/LPS O-acetylase OafA/YrhL
MTNPTHFKRHIPALDGLRGLAILMILFHHFLRFGGLQPAVFLDKLYYKITYAGWMGVDLFFVLSGFLITGILYDTRREHHFFRSFYMRRFLRIFPLYYGFLAFFFIILPLINSPGPEYEMLRNKQVWYWTYLTNIDMAINGWPTFRAIGHFWSLAIEEQFYLFWPLLVFCFRRRSFCRLCVVIILSAIGFRLSAYLLAMPRLYTYLLTPARMDSLAVGALIAVLARDPVSQAVMNRWARPLFAITGMALFGFFVWKRNLNVADPLMYTLGFTVIALFFGALMILAINSSSENLFARLFSSKILMFLGRYSYALYVFHFPLLAYFRSKGYIVLLFPSIMGSQLPGQFIYIALTAPIILIISFLSWHLWESRFLKLKRFFPYDIEKEKMVLYTAKPEPESSVPRRSTKSEDGPVAT